MVHKTYILSPAFTGTLHEVAFVVDDAGVPTVAELMVKATAQVDATSFTYIVPVQFVVTVPVPRV